MNTNTTIVILECGGYVKDALEYIDKPHSNDDQLI